MRRILVTSALPYANGHIHIGHLVEYLQTDIWVRFQKLRGRRCVYFCADDTHGTAIMIRARQEGLGEEELIARMRQAHVADFTGFQIEFDNYGSTNSPETREICGEIWAALRKAGLVEEKEVTQLYDAQAGTFLADRFVKGTCPKCQSPGQYGDSCDKCGTHYDPTDLLDPVSTLSGTKPEIRTADHLFVQHREAAPVPRRVDAAGRAPPAGNRQLSDRPLPRRAAARLGRLAAGAVLRLRDSRQPGQLLVRLVRRPDRLHRLDVAVVPAAGREARRLVAQPGDRNPPLHRQGHHLFPHAVLAGDAARGRLQPARRRSTSTAFSTVNGEKMSKSKGTFIRASTYLEHLDPAYLRYYYASKLTSRVDDIDLSFEEFAAKVNADMVGNIVNLASRTARFAAETGLAATYPDDGGLFAQAAADGQAIAESYDAGDYAKAVRLILAAGDRANQFVEQRAPWNLRKDRLQDGRASPSLHDRAEPLPPVGHLPGARVAAAGPADRRVAGRSNRVVGPVAAAAFGQAGGKVQPHDAADRPQAGRGDGGRQRRAGRRGTAGRERPLRQRRPALGRAAGRNHRLRRVRPGRFAGSPGDCGRGRAGAQKLLKLTLGLGGQNHRTVLAGIKGAYKPEELVGRLVICAANLAPRKMKFGPSEGMIVAAGGGGEIFLLSPDPGAKPGQRVH